MVIKMAAVHRVGGDAVHLGSWEGNRRPGGK